MEFLFRGVLKKENLDEPNKWIYGGIYPVPKKKGCFSYIITRNSAYYHQFKKEEVYTVTQSVNIPAKTIRNILISSVMI